MCCHKQFQASSKDKPKRMDSIANCYRLDETSSNQCEVGKQPLAARNTQSRMIQHHAHKQKDKNNRGQPLVRAPVAQL